MAEQPPLEVTEERRINLQLLQDQDSYCPEKIALDSRVLIIEGIAGSGKDTFQAYLKEKLKGRDIYDFSEGEVLHSWKHFPIDGILKLRISFMKLFVNYVSNVVRNDPNVVFLLNRFHLSTYVSTITRQPELEREYDAIVDVLRTIPVHVFILQLDENDIEARSSHPERPSAWQKLQQQMITKDGCRDKFERYLWQQKLILEVAKRQQIPYSTIKFSRQPGTRSAIHLPNTQGIFPRGLRINIDAKVSRRKRGLVRSS